MMHRMGQSMNNNDAALWEASARYVRGEISGEELRHIEEPYHAAERAARLRLARRQRSFAYTIRRIVHSVLPTWYRKVDRESRVNTMEIIAKTERYSAQQLMAALNPTSGQSLCVVLGGDQPGEYIIVVDTDHKARLVRGMLDHIGVAHNDAANETEQAE